MRCAVAFGLLAACQQTAGFELTGIQPNPVVEGVDTPVTLGGRNLFASVRVDLDDRSAPEVGRNWSVTVDGNQLPAMLSGGALSITVPGTLAAGSYEVTVTSPAAESQLVPDLLEVTPRAPATWTVIETLTVPVDPVMGISAKTTSTTVLQAGVVYHLRASGTWIIQSDAIPPTQADAEWWSFSAPVEGVAGTDVGLGIDDAAALDPKQPKWGPYTDTHVYEVEWVGAGKTIDANIHDQRYDNDSGFLTLEILELR